MDRRDRLCAGIGALVVAAALLALPTAASAQEAPVCITGKERLDDGVNHWFGSRHRDSVTGLRGEDRMNGRAGGDFINGGRNNDVVTGGAGDAELGGGRGHDVI